MKSSLKMFWISIVIMFISSPCVIHSQPDVALPMKLQLPQANSGARANGPEDLVFDPMIDQVFYTALNDGRIVKFVNGNFTDFATTSPLRSKAICDGISITETQPICGRPIGLDFDRRNGDLYVVDIFYGLLKVGKNGGLATQLAGSVEGLLFGFTESVAVDQSTGDVYFVDAGAIFRTLNFELIVNSGDKTGKLLKYEAATKRVTVVLSGLSGPAGMAMSEDDTFIVISEFIGRRVIKHFIRGPKSNTTETVLENLQGQPDNVKRAESSEGFWVAVSIQKPLPQQLQPLPEPPQVIPRTDSIAVNFDMNGKILKRRNVTNGFPNSFSVYLEHSGKAYTGSLLSEFVGVYDAI